MNEGSTKNYGCSIRYFPNYVILLSFMMNYEIAYVSCLSRNFDQSQVATSSQPSPNPIVEIISWIKSSN